MNRIHDVSVPLYAGCPAWPGDGNLVHRFLSSMGSGKACNTSFYSSPAHLGTHLDAPRHFIDGGATIDQLDPALFIGPALVVQVRTPKDGHVAADTLASAMKGRRWPQRLLLKTRNSRPGGAMDSEAFDKGFCALTLDAAEMIVRKGVRLIGIDYYSIAPFAEGAPVHRAILGAGLAALEGLDLRKVPPGPYRLVALPIKLRGFEGAPVRAVLISA